MDKSASPADAFGNLRFGHQIANIDALDLSAATRPVNGFDGA
jgi:hypothetical protein